MRRKTSRRTKAALFSGDRGRAALFSTRRRAGILGNGKGLAKTLATSALVRTGKRKAKKMYATVSDGIKEHPLRSIGLITLGMGIISTLYLLQHRHTH